MHDARASRKSDTARVIAALVAFWLWIGSTAGQAPCRYVVEYIPNPPPCQYWERYVGVTGISPNGRYVCGAISDCNLGNYAVVVDTQPPGGGAMQMTVIPRPAGIVDMIASGVNDKNEVCGTMYYYWGTGGSRTFLWRDGVVTNLGVPDGTTDSFGYAINSKTEITGECFEVGSRRAYLWRKGSFTLLNLPIGSGSVGFDIDDDSRIVGYMGGNQFTSHAFIWSDSKVTDLGVIPDGDSAAAYSISSDGCIAGFGADHDYPPGERARAFFFSKGQMYNLGLLPGAVESRASGTNGHVTVGTCSFANDSAGFTFANGMMRRLDQMQDDPNLVIPWATAISENGFVAAHAIVSGTHFGVRLVPAMAPTGDLNADCKVNVQDLLGIINQWGACDAGGFCNADLNNDGIVNQMDMLVVIQHWGQQS